MSAVQSLTQSEMTGCCFPPGEDVGFGILQTPMGNLPLKMLDVAAQVSGLLSHVHMRQTFVNTLRVPIEATYIFPLPDRAAVSSFRFEVGERIIDGVLKERGEARREYDQAIATGHRAAIAEEERAGVFTMRVGNLMPGEEATIHLTIDGPLPYSDGEATFRFPLVVAPRYIPGAAVSGEQVGDGVAFDTDAVPDASRISPPVLLPGFPNPIQLSLSVELDSGGLPLGPVRSSLHAVRTRQDGRQRIELQPGERLDRDFVLRFGLGGEELGSSLLLHPDADGEDEGTFQLSVVPPLGMAKAIKPRDVVFVLDRSGSMDGWKMIAARRACGRMIDSLTDADRFGVLAFDNVVERPPHARPGELLAGTNRNRYRTIEYLSGLEARGGTEMARPLKDAVEALLGHDAGAERERILILITDGQVGNEDQILRSLGRSLEELRVFTLGIDRAVNAGFLRRLAGLGGGSCELVESEDRLDDVMDKVHRRIGTPLLTSLSLEAAGVELLSETLAPARLPDLFAGAPLRISGRYRGKPAGTALTVSATDGVGRPWSESVSAAVTSNTALTKVWARARVRDLEDRFQQASGGARRELTSTITATSLRFGVLCRFTSFVAVDRSTVVNAGGQVHKVTQAVEQPEGWGKQEASKRRSLSAPPGPAPSPFDSPFAGGFAVPASAPIQIDPFSAPSSRPIGSDPFAAPSSAPMGAVSFKKPAGGDPFGPPMGLMGAEGGEATGDADAFGPPAGGAPGAAVFGGGGGFGAPAPKGAPPTGDPFGADPFGGSARAGGMGGMGAPSDGLHLDFEESEPFASAPPPPPAPGYFPPPASRARKAKPRGGKGRKKGKKKKEGLLEKVLGAISGKSSAEAAPHDGLAPYRRRAKALLELLAAGEHASRLRELSRLRLLLEGLLEDMRSVGHSGPALKQLERLHEKLGVVLTRRAIGDDELEELVKRTREVLTGFVAGEGESTPPPSRKDEFWM